MMMLHATLSNHAPTMLVTSLEILAAQQNDKSPKRYVSVYNKLSSQLALGWRVVAVHHACSKSGL